MFSPEQLRMLHQALNPVSEVSLNVAAMPTQHAPPPPQTHHATPCTSSRMFQHKPDHQQPHSPTTCSTTPCSLTIAYSATIFTLAICAITHSFHPFALALPGLTTVTFFDAFIARTGENPWGRALARTLWAAWVVLLTHSVLFASTGAAISACLALSLLQGTLSTCMGHDSPGKSIYATVISAVATLATGIVTTAYYLAPAHAQRCLLIASACVTIQCVCTVLMARGTQITVRAA